MTPTAAATAPYRARTAMRSAVAVARARLRERLGARIGFAGALLVAVIFSGIAVVLRNSGTAGDSFGELLASAAGWITWVGAGPMAFAAARDRVSMDRRDGIDVLAAAHGIDAGLFDGASALAAMIETSLAIGAPSVALATLLAALGGTRGIAAHYIASAVALAVFALVAGATVGAVASACGRIGRRRGRLLLAAVVLGPWALADLAGRGGWSLPGALEALLDAALDAVRSGAVA